MSQIFKISVDLVNQDDVIMIVGHPTGVYYEAQCGGLACQHKSFEGFVMTLGSATFNEINDCKYGCDHIQDIPGAAQELARDIHKSLMELTVNWRYTIGFDFERIKELEEGWWPVIIIGEIDSWNHTEGEFKGIIHTGNCD